jgi:hypothetical protein
LFEGLLGRLASLAYMLALLVAAIANVIGTLLRQVKSGTGRGWPWACSPSWYGHQSRPQSVTQDLVDSWASRVPASNGAAPAIVRLTD